MKQLVEFESDAGPVLVEVDLPESATEPVSRIGEVVKAGKRFEEALDQVRPAAQAVIAKLRDLTDEPDEIAVEFAIKLGAKAGAIIAAADVEANYKVSLKWQKR